MTPWRVLLQADGSVTLAELPPLIAHYLLELPDWIEEDPDGPTRKRLYPSPDPNNAEKTAEWERLMVPELFALVASAREIIEQDLMLLAQTVGIPGHGRLKIPAQHVEAWIRGLQVARLSMAAENEVVEGDLDDWPEPEVEPDKAEAIVCVSLLGEIQGLLIEVGSGIPGVPRVGQTDGALGSEFPAHPFGDELVDTFEAFLGQDLLDDEDDDDEYEDDDDDDDDDDDEFDHDFDDDTHEAADSDDDHE